VSDTDSLDAAMCRGQCDVSTSSFKVKHAAVSTNTASMQSPVCKICMRVRVYNTPPLSQGALCAYQAAEQREEADQEGDFPFVYVGNVERR